MAVQVHGVVLEDVYLRLDFEEWALVLDGTSAQGTLAFTVGADGQRLTYEALGIDARKGGSLRVGRRNHPWAAVVAFTRVQIDRFSTVGDAPADMLLEVASASTGRSLLSGRAQFTDIFPWGRRSRSPGMDLDARWKDVGDAIEVLERNWGLSDRLPGRLDGDVAVRLKGPFSRLAGRVQAIGQHAQLEVGMDVERRIDASMQFDDIVTDGVLDRTLAPLLGGLLSGRLKAHGKLAAGILGVAATIDEATLRLDRTRGGPWPRRFNVSTRAVPGSATADELDVFFKGARFEQGLLSMSEVRASMSGATVRGAASARLYDARTGKPLPNPFLESRARARDIDLARLVPGGLVRGRLSMSSEVRGFSDELAVAVRFPEGSAVEVANQTLALPTRFEARLFGGDRLVVPSFRLGDTASGAIEVGGSIVFDGPIDAELAVVRYPIERLVKLAGIPVSGHLDSDVRVTGETRHPRVEGKIGFADVRVGDTVLGSGAITFAPAGGATVIDGQPIPAVTVHGRLVTASRPRLSGNLQVNDLPLDPFVAQVPGLSGRLSGRADVDAGLDGFAVRADVDQVALGYRLPRTSYTLALANVEPARLSASHKGASLSPVKLRGTGIEAVASGTMGGNHVRAEIQAQLALAAFGDLLRPLIKETAGVVDLALRADGSPRAPALSGALSVREAVRVWPAALMAPVQVGGGTLAFDGPRIQARKLALSIASVALEVDGQATLDPEVTGDTRLDARITGSVDGGALARRLPALFDDGHGRATLDGRVGGTVAAPTFDGHADFHGFGGRMPGAPVDLRSLDGRIEARGQTLSTTALSLALGPSGRLQIGSPQAPATVVISSIDPPNVARMSVPVRGQDLATAAPISGLQLRDLDLQVNLDHAGTGPLRLSGDVWIQGASLLPDQMRPAAPRPVAKLENAGARVARNLFPEITLDLGVHSPDGALEVVIPYLPDIAVTLDCRVVGPLRRTKVDGRAHGDGLYWRLAVWLYDLFSDAHVRRCGAR